MSCCLQMTEAQHASLLRVQEEDRKEEAEALARAKKAAKAAKKARQKERDAAARTAAEQPPEAAPPAAPAPMTGAQSSQKAAQAAMEGAATVLEADSAASSRAEAGHDRRGRPAASSVARDPALSADVQQNGGSAAEHGHVDSPAELAIGQLRKKHKQPPLPQVAKPAEPAARACS